MHKKLLTIGSLCSFALSFASIGLVVNLTAGNDTILFANGSAWAPDIDRITISASPVFTPNNTYSLTNSNSSKVLDDPNSSLANRTGLIQLVAMAG